MIAMAAQSFRMSGSSRLADTPDLAAAQSETDAALSKISSLQAPVLAYQAHLLGGQLAQTRNDRSAALSAYQEARKCLEGLRSLPVSVDGGLVAAEAAQAIAHQVKEIGPVLPLPDGSSLPQGP